MMHKGTYSFRNKEHLAVTRPLHGRGRALKTVRTSQGQIVPIRPGGMVDVALEELGAALVQATQSRD